MTIRAWRLVKAKYVADAFSGEGSRRFGGRWNPPGARVVYAAEHISLAALEVLVQLSGLELGEEFTLLGVEFGGALVRDVRLEELPHGWRSLKPTPATRQFGARWLEGGTSPVLRVPSVVVEQESNFLLNVEHAKFADIRRLPPRRFVFDPRFGERKRS